MTNILMWGKGMHADDELDLYDGFTTIHAPQSNDDDGLGPLMLKAFEAIEGWPR